jgi:hypothetical protein
MVGTSGEDMRDVAELVRDERVRVSARLEAPRWTWPNEALTNLMNPDDKHQRSNSKPRTATVQDGYTKFIRVPHFGSLDRTDGPGPSAT